MEVLSSGHFRDSCKYIHAHICICIDQLVDYYDAQNGTVFCPSGAEDLHNYLCKLMKNPFPIH